MALATAPVIPSDEALAKRCRSVGLRATTQRLAVWRALLETKAHPSPEGVFRAVRARVSSVSLATIYKTLDSLESAGLIEQVSKLSETKRYDGNLDPHHHLVCRVCKAVIDHDDPTLDVALPAGLPGFLAESVRIEVVGVCATCVSIATNESSRATSSTQRGVAPRRPDHA
jgi:Fur family peroxide stress response transcriptional regulator